MSIQLKSHLIENSSTNSVDKQFVGSFSFIRDVNSTGFHNLPVNVLLIIFSYLNENDLRRSVISVCHKWRQVASLPILWHKLKFQGFHVPQQFICQQLRTLTNLQCVFFINIYNTATVLRQLCRCNPRIKTIVLKNCKNSQTENRIPERVLRNLIATCRQLQEISLKGTLFNGNLFYLEVALLPELRSINLSNNMYMKKKNLYELILNCHNLEELKLSYGCQEITDYDIVFLFSNLKSSLKSITFDTMYLTDISFKALLECRKLNKLYLYNAKNMTSEIFVHIWKKLPDLKHLKIHNCQIETEYFVQLFTEGKSVLEQLEMINFSCASKLNGTGLKAISECCPNLLKAVFKCCKNIDTIKPLIENCTKLKCLNVAFCIKIPDENLIEATQNLKDLQLIYMDSTRKSILPEFKVNKQKLNVYICLSEFNDKVEIM